MYRIGIDLGGTNIKAGIVDEGQNILREKFVPTLAERQAREVIADMAELVRSILQEESLGFKDVSGIGIGCPGMIDAKNGEVPYSNNLCWEYVPLAALLKKYLNTDCPVKVSNDANCAALGEAKAGAAKGVDNVVLLTLGTGVGGGVISEGRVFEGAHAGGAELGHTTLVMGGEACTCGRKGCVEAYASATALIRDARRETRANPDSLMYALCQGDLKQMNGKIPFDAMEKGDACARTVLERYFDYLAEAIANFVNLFRPDVVLLSGGICNQGKNLTEPLNKRLCRLCFGGERAFVPEIKCATLGNLAGIIGAANLISHSNE